MRGSFLTCHVHGRRAETEKETHVSLQVSNLFFKICDINAVAKPKNLRQFSIEILVPQ